MSAKSFTLEAKEKVAPGLIDGSLSILEKALMRGKGIVAYSGGKDAIVVALLAQKLGVIDGVCELSFCFTQQETDIKKQAISLGFNVQYRKKFDLRWLARHPQFVFNNDTKQINAFCQIRQRDSCEKYALQNGYKVVITGRKNQGNSIKDTIYERRNGTVGAHPLREWTDGDIWAYLRDKGIPRPWIYGTPFGLAEGNSFWPICRQYPDRDQNYTVIYGIEPNIVLQAARFGIIGAAEFLANNGIYHGGTKSA
ncbi:MAG: phosphoadenosine phosphosulfate reductase family protein [Treponema sp.]|jgi:3'-phosphoadenosine 5'-phosphosulfate sulfotransferase (PAPS reductase)/FAD synthetase|nr:phosphoadenosine phosphosulfate reductase family protein [Treponema sp.]